MITRGITSCGIVLRYPLTLTLPINRFLTFLADHTDVFSTSPLPIFIEDQRALARELFQARAIDRAELIEMTDPPGKQTLLRNLKKIEEKEAAAAKAQQEAAAKKEGLRVAK